MLIDKVEAEREGKVQSDCSEKRERESKRERERVEEEEEEIYQVRKQKTSNIQYSEFTLLPIISHGGATVWKMGNSTQRALYRTAKNA